MLLANYCCQMDFHDIRNMHSQSKPIMTKHLLWVAGGLSLRVAQSNLPIFRPTTPSRLPATHCGPVELAGWQCLRLIACFIMIAFFFFMRSTNASSVNNFDSEMLSLARTRTTANSYQFKAMRTGKLCAAGQLVKVESAKVAPANDLRPSYPAIRLSGRRIKNVQRATCHSVSH